MDGWMDKEIERHVYGELRYAKTKIHREINK
jgi:hypothetical protein